MTTASTSKEAVAAKDEQSTLPDVQGQEDQENMMLSEGTASGSNAKDGTRVKANDATEKQPEKGKPRFGPLSMVGFLLLLICVPGLCCWFCWIKVMNKGRAYCTGWETGHVWHRPLWSS